MKLKSKKSALLLSFTSLLLCFAMLAGSTFAWFTDTATTGVNQIKSGTLDVGLEMAIEWDSEGKPTKWANAEGKTLTFKTADNRAADKIFWEPNCTYKLPELRVVNNGNLALKYKLQITGIQGDAKLNKVIEWKINGEDINLTEKHLLAGTANSPTYSEPITISGHMKKEAGNEYQNLTIDGISITVYATQLNSEFDSFNNTYDENATYYPVLDAAGLKDALVNGGNIKVDSSFDAGNDALAVNKDTVLDMNGKTISNTADIWDESKADWSLISARNGAKLTITGNGTFKAKENDSFTVDVQDGATVTIEDGTFIGNIHAVYVYEGTANIKGGFYAVQQKYTDANKADGFVLNCYDANRTNGTAKIIVTGGTFVNFNPADCWAEGEHTNFVADGYSVISEQHGADTWYTVVRAADSEDTLKAAIEEGAPYIQLTGDISICENGSVAFDKDFVLDGNGHSVYAKEQLKILGGDVVFRDVTFSSPRALFVKGANFVMEETATIESEVDGNAAIWLYGNANAEIRGTVIAPKAYGICVNRAETDAPNMVKIDGAKVESWGPALYVNGSWGGHEVSAVHSTFTNTNGQCVYISGANGEGKGQTVTLIDCTIEGTTAVEVKHSDVKLTGCTLTATGDPTSYTENNNGGTALGYCFATTSNSKGEKIDPTSGTIEFENCTFNPKVSGCEVFNSYANESGNRGATINGYENSKILYPAKLTPNP